MASKILKKNFRVGRPKMDAIYKTMPKGDGVEVRGDVSPLKNSTFEHLKSPPFGTILRLILNEQILKNERKIFQKHQCIKIIADSHLSFRGACVKKLVMP